jgi:hypothetical protein
VGHFFFAPRPELGFGVGYMRAVGKYFIPAVLNQDAARVCPGKLNPGRPVGTAVTENCPLSKCFYKEPCDFVRGLLVAPFSVRRPLFVASGFFGERIIATDHFLLPLTHCHKTSPRPFRVEGWCVFTNYFLKTRETSTPLKEGADDLNDARIRHISTIQRNLLLGKQL